MAELEKTTFQAVGATGDRMPGSPAVLAAGFPGLEHAGLRALLDAHGLEEVPLICMTAETLELTLDALSRLPDGTGAGQEAHLPRAVVTSGLTGQQLHALMGAYRESAMARPIWATVTAVSGSWTMKYLLVELLKEREALRQAQAARAGQPANS